MSLPVRTKLKHVLSFIHKFHPPQRSQLCAAACADSKEPPGGGRVFSGIQPTGVPHLGNYLGALENWVALQNQYPSILYSIVDLHSITQTQDPAQLRGNILDMTASLLACGVDPERAILFQQSQASKHSLTEEGEGLEGRGKSTNRENEEDNNNHSSSQFFYAANSIVCSSSGVLELQSTHVPVGEDQIQHLELAQDLARIFNNRYGNLFPEPSALLSSTRKVKSLRDPSAKMSKSDPQAMATINITDSPDDIALKVRRAVTDFTSEVTFDPETRPGVSNLVTIHAAMAMINVEEALSQARGLDTGAYKKLVTEAVVQRLTPIREEIERLRSDHAHLEGVLAQGTRRARELAAPVLREVRQRVGFC
ncbi:Tryptophan--tRNA ligase, mitochondrial [Larimichthys crocea]|uniref:Uncharacterized protein n=1 Tax=Larimichthys crocea TaxID=215358 RepID=A0ACD3QK33_LARCR|nr:Tryptophan--tRNA ligase, mitochondrial [Larimichthys crocea]